MRAPLAGRRAVGPGLVLAAVAAAVVAAPAAAQPFTVEDVLSAPFPSGLVAAPAGDRVAWVVNDGGRRNVWVAEAPDFRGRAVTDYRDDDGQELGSLAFTPDGERVVFVRGGAPNREGWVPDPHSTTDGAERALWVVPVRGGEPRKLAEGASPAVSPAGDRVAYPRGGSIWTVGLDEGAEPVEAVKVRGGPGDLAWSPDGRRLAFTSRRGDHAFVGVVDPDGGRIVWLDPSVDRDGSPAWSPDGRRVAFVRVANERERLPFTPRREAHPWSIRVADASTGEGREVWRAGAGSGSAFQGVSSDPQLFWGAGDRLVFPWEREGWLRLWSVPLSGGEARLLTPGEGEVQHATLSPDRRRVVYDSNAGDVDRKHLWEASVAGGEARLLTPGEGLEWAPAVTSGGTVAFLGSGPREPARPFVLADDGRRAMDGGLPASFPSPDELVVPEAVVFPAADGLPIHGQLFLPPDARAGEARPAVLFFHGGSRRQMLLGFHHRGYYHNAYALNQLLASRGYVVLAVNYRSGIGYGLDFREAEDYGAGGASEFADVLGAGLYLAARPDVDRDRIGLWGGSYGGYLTALGLARASDLFAAGVDLHGVHDWNVVVRNFVPDYDAEARDAFARLAYESSPMAHLAGWRSPVLLIHGDDDRNVPFSESVDLAESLRDLDVEFEQLVFPDEVHGFLLHESWIAAYEATVDFLDRKLRGAGARAAGADGPARDPRR